MGYPAAPQHRGLIARDATRASTIFVRALLEAAEVAGIRADLLMRDAGISPAQIVTPYAWVEIGVLDRGIGVAVELSQDPALGLHWNERSMLMKFDVLAMAIAYAPTLREALRSLQRFQTILVEHPEVDVEERADAVYLRCAPLATTELALRVRTELAISGLVRLLRNVGVPAEAIRRIAFAHAAPPHVAEYTRIFGASVSFGAESSGVEFDLPWLEHRVPHSNEELYQQLTKQAQDIHERMHASANYAHRVRDYLRVVFPRTPDVSEVCRALAVSERSLRRRLSEEGASYSTIVQETRQVVAQQMITDPNLTIAEVGRALGFATVPAFHRAFKRWTGETPHEFKERKSRPARRSSQDK